MSRGVVGRQLTHAGWVEPRRGPATEIVSQLLVCRADARIDYAHHRAGTVKAKPPQRICSNSRDRPRSSPGGRDVTLKSHRFSIHDLIRFSIDRCHFGARRQRSNCAGRGLDNHPVHDGESALLTDGAAGAKLREKA